MLADVTRLFAYTLFIVSLCGPWTTYIADLFAIDLFIERPVHQMIWYLLTKFPIAMISGFAFFILPPALFTILYLIRPKDYIFLEKYICYFCKIISVVSTLSLVFVFSNTTFYDNPLGDIFMIDLLILVFVHFMFIFNGNINGETILCGPLYSMVEITQKKIKLKGIGIPILLLIICVPRLTVAFETLELIDSSFIYALKFQEWHPLEIYACIQVITGFVYLSFISAKIDKTIKATLQLLVFIIINNANVASAWLVFLIL